MSNRMKQWRCKRCNCILGFIKWNGAGLPHLMVLRQALDMDVEHPNDVDVLGPLHGQMPIRCSNCDEVKVWEMSVEALLAIFPTFSDKKLFEFSQRLLEMSSKVFDTDDPANMEVRDAL